MDGAEEHGTEDISRLPQTYHLPEALLDWASETAVWVEHGAIVNNEDAAYFASGGFDSEAGARDAHPEGTVSAGESNAHTFEIAGSYGNFRVPHERSGITGTVVVEEG